MDKLQQITSSDTYKQILADSCGGIMYNVTNRDKYDTTEILKLWDSLTASEKDYADGIITGAMNFIQGN